MNTLYKLARRSLFAPTGLLMMAFLPFLSLPAAAVTLYGQTNLVSDIPGLAPVTDANLVNPWGISHAPNGPFWISDNGKGVTTLYQGNGSKVPLVVTIPPPAGGSTSAPTGQVFNSTNDFMISSGGASGPSRFLFATEDGTISGWNPAVPPPPPPLSTQAFFGVDNSATGAVYKGLALAKNGSDNFLYAANFHNNTIDVFDKDFAPTTLAGSFTDPHPVAGFAPFNIQLINGNLYVTYAKQKPGTHDDEAGLGNGYIDIFGTNGNFIQRFASGTAAGGKLTQLNSPWGMTIAPDNFGTFSGDLLVGNFGSGLIDAFDSAGNFLGQLQGLDGNPLAIDGLWALTTGAGVLNADPNRVYFTAGLNDESHGLFGSLAVPEPGTLSLLGACAISGLIFRRRHRA
jgi:uncharacterized protein (TIGR03118 family)